MGWIKKLIPSGYVRKLILFGMMIGCLPVMIVGTFSYYRTASMLNDKNLEQNQQQILQTKSYVEYTLTNADVILYSFISSRSVQNAMMSDMRGEDFMVLQEVSRQISSAIPFDVANTDISLVNYARNWVLNSNGLYRLDEAVFGKFYSDYGKLPKTSQWVTYVDEIPKGQTVYDYFFAGDSVFLVKKIPLNSIHPAGVAIIKIPCAFLNKSLVAEQGNSKVVILDSEFQVVASAGKEIAGKDLSGSELVTQIQKGENFETEIDGERFNVMAVKSEYNGWYYVSFISIDEVLRDSRIIRHFTVLMICLCLVAVVIVSIMGSKRMYRPIYGLYQMMLGSMSEGEEQDELAFMKKRLSGLVMDTSQQSDQIKAQIRQIQEYMTIKILLGDISKLELEQRLPLFEKDSNDMEKRVVVIGCDRLEGTGYTEGDLDILMFAINNIAGELLEKYILLTPVVVRKSQATIVKCPKEEKWFRENLQQITESIQENMLKNFGVSVSVGISRTFVKYEDAEYAFEEGLNALKYRIKQGTGTMVFYEDMQLARGKDSVSYLKSRRELVEAVKALDKERAVSCLDIFLDEVFERHVSHLEYQIPAAGLLTELMNVVSEAGADVAISQDGEKSLMEQLFELQTREEIRQWFAERVITPFINALCAINDTQSKKLAVEMIALIKQEFDQDLTLESCGQRMN